MNINKSISWPKKFWMCWSHVHSISSNFCHIFTNYFFFNFRFSVFSERKQSALLTQINVIEGWSILQYFEWKLNAQRGKTSFWSFSINTFTNSTPSHDLWALLLKVMVRICLSPSTPPPTRTHIDYIFFFLPPCISKWEILEKFVFLCLLMFIHVKPVTFERFHLCPRFFAYINPFKSIKTFSDKSKTLMIIMLAALSVC